MHLDTKGAADILADYPHLAFLEPKVQRGDILHHMWRLSALIDREPLFSGVPVSDDRSRLKRHAGMPAEDEIRFSHFVRVSKSLIDGSCIMDALEGEIIAKLRVDDRRLQIQRFAHVGHGCQL